MFRIYKVTKYNSKGFVFLENDFAAINNFDNWTFPIDMNFNYIFVGYNCETYTGPYSKIYNKESGFYIKRQGNPNYSNSNPHNSGSVYRFKRHVELHKFFEIYEGCAELIYEDKNISNELLREKLPECYY